VTYEQLNSCKITPSALLMVKSSIIV